ncbi:ribonuclease H-like domain-containing protein [Natrononativus amylolyticus]|uniref:ribonuclease H-like domain-containing protein n=1 Tax=Natrononativus amylolyticus TaxID=2963434 RepID=UPI0020CF880F|nr:ribonuclease H-like domain-containing protein [Natrononativus amylolyticus]
MRYNRDGNGYDRIATFDIETTHWKATEGETVSVGIAVHDCGAPGSDIQYKPFHRNSTGDEAELIARALEYVDDCGVDALVSYNGRDFDMDFLHTRQYLLGEDKIEPEIDTPATHIDLFEDRKKKCNRTGEKWPKLEECLATYKFAEPETLWNGRPVTNKRFGEELGPAYLAALEDNDRDQADSLREVIDHYLVTDLEANLAIYYADTGQEFKPHYLGTRAVF